MCFYVKRHLEYKPHIVPTYRRQVVGEGLVQPVQVDKPKDKEREDQEKEKGKLTKEKRDKEDQERQRKEQEQELEDAILATV